MACENMYNKITQIQKMSRRFNLNLDKIMN